MNTVTNISVAKEVEDLSIFDPHLGAYSFENLGEVVQFADLMAKAGPMLPEHCQNQPAICLAVTMRATHWGFDPFALAQETFQTKPNSPIAYSAKVFVAALKNCAGVKLQYRYEGSFEMLNEPAKSARGNIVAQRKAVGTRRCIAFAEVDGVLKEYTTPELDQITIKNSALWHNDPDQQLAYFAGRGWTRRYEAGVIMGAHSTDEVESMEPMRDVTPEPTKGSFSAKADAAREKASATAIESQQTVDPVQGEDKAAVEAEIVPQEDSAEFDRRALDPHWTDEVPWNDAFPGADEFNEGATAFNDNRPLTDCPYQGDAPKAVDWVGGWKQAQQAAS